MAEYTSNPFFARGIEFIDSRAGGKYFDGTRDQTRMIKFTHPTGQCSTCFHDSGLKMECGHYICPDDLLDWAWEQLSNMKHEIGCTECGKTIQQDDVIKFGLPTLEEKQFLLTAITTNFCESQDIQTCPKCRTLCQRDRTDNPQVHCTVCAKKRGSVFMFCWYCMREWNNPSDAYVCGNANCKKELIEKLINSPKKVFIDNNGKRVIIPIRRACPGCQTLYEHTDGCNLFTCESASCKQQFCFICLSKKIAGSLICKSVSYSSTGVKCSPAPIQTKLK